MTRKQQSPTNSTYRRRIKSGVFLSSWQVFDLVKMGKTLKNKILSGEFEVTIFEESSNKKKYLQVQEILPYSLILKYIHIVESIEIY